MSAMANVTPIIATVKNDGVKEKTLKEADAIIMDRARHDKRKEVQTRLDFGESPKKTRRKRENFLNSRAENSPIRFHHERSRTRGRKRPDDRNVFNRLSHHKKSVHERLSDTYSLSITKFEPSRASSRDPFHSRGRSLESSTSDRGHWKSRVKRRKPADEEDLAIPWTCEDIDPFTPRIRNFKSSWKTRMPNNVKTYDGTGDLEDHLKIF
ncbi:hypothetical protein Tco_0677491 [Tanacetum coccineum]|uniref:Reverse transcriptase domain-containing protein n=1 Tax=Tanacetum coccineum TaxID=301880 RepID=A0ABQ4XCB4_9ASTR